MTRYIQCGYDDNDEPVLYPAEWVICRRCRGDGTHGNPAFDGMSTDDEMFEDEDFRDGLMEGRYDVCCTECNGEGKVLEVNIIACSHDQLDAYYAWANEEAESRALDAQERRMGA